MTLFLTKNPPIFSPEEFAAYLGLQGAARKIAQQKYKCGPEAVARRKAEAKAKAKN